MGMIMVCARSRFLLLVIVLLLSFTACELPKIAPSALVWVTNLPISFSGSVHVVEHHVTSDNNITCALDTIGKLAVDEKGKVVFTTQGGTFTVGKDGNCVEQGKDEGWQIEGQVELPTSPYLKFNTCSSGHLRAEGSAEYIVAEYQQDTQTSKLTGGITCYDENNIPVSEFGLYLTAKEPRR
jgi:hypothetical protein